ncbi:uncharacterized protein LOC124369843 [Homalodisca vitripennis]|uniref:uncharacterized protein LOC124369843 n=1 Tax=Homalodisca vitripennis TaxID=197043 RepID=UPI001EEA2585|nr:uncharacterized protein LOC124369843 [Homalodisca vitripennis]
MSTTGVQKATNSSTSEPEDGVQEPASQVDQATNSSTSEPEDGVQEPASQVVQTINNSALESSDGAQEPAPQYNVNHDVAGPATNQHYSTQPLPQWPHVLSPSSFIDPYGLPPPNVFPVYNPPRAGSYMHAPQHLYSQYPTVPIYNARGYGLIPTYDSRGYGPVPYYDARGYPTVPIYDCRGYQTHLNPTAPAYYPRGYQPARAAETKVTESLEKSDTSEETPSQKLDLTVTESLEKSDTSEETPSQKLDLTIMESPEKSEKSEETPSQNWYQIVVTESLEKSDTSEETPSQKLDLTIMESPEKSEKSEETPSQNWYQIVVTESLEKSDTSEETPSQKLDLTVMESPEKSETSEETPSQNLELSINKQNLSQEYLEDDVNDPTDYTAESFSEFQQEEPKVTKSLFIYQVNKEVKKFVKKPPLSVPEELTEPQWIQPFTKEDLQLIDFENPLHLKIYVDSESAVVLRLREDKPSISVRINTKGQLQVLWDKMTITLDVTWTTFSILHNLVHIQAKILSATNITLPAQLQFINIMAERILFGSYKEEDGNEYISENVFRLSNAGLVKKTSINLPKVIGEVFCKSNGIEDAISLGTLIMLKKSSTQEHWKLGHNVNVIFTPSTGELRIEKEGNSLIIKGSEVFLTTNLNTEEALMRTVIDSEKEEIVIHNTVTKTKVVLNIPQETLEFTTRLYRVIATGFKEPRFNVQGFYT